MSNNALREYLELQEIVARLQRDADKSQGALDQLKKRLAKEFGCSSIKQARQLLRRLESDEERDTAAFEQALAKFRTKYKERLQ